MSEKRTFIRIPTRLRGFARAVDGDEMPIFQSAAPESRAGKLPDKVKNVPEPLWDMLLDINSKLDMLMSQVNQNRIRDDFPFTLVITELSGAGIQFKTRADFKQGDIIEVAMVLSEFPLRMAGAVGKVIRAESGDSMALEFTKIREKDTEAIVQFVFREQREQIRGEKWS